jgi:hypothetical protein
MVLISIITLLCEHWNHVATIIGLTSFQMVVVLGMGMSGMMIKWTFQQEQEHQHDD